MIKKELVLGKQLKEAIQIVKEYGLKSEIYKYNDIISLETRPNTVLLFHKKGIVKSAIMGE